MHIYTSIYAKDNVHKEIEIDTDKPIEEILTKIENLTNDGYRCEAITGFKIDPEKHIALQIRYLLHTEQILYDITEMIETTGISQIHAETVINVFFRRY